MTSRLASLGNFSMNFPELGPPQILTRKRALYTSSNAHPHTPTTTNRNFLGDLFIDFKYSFYFRNWRTYWVCFSLLLVVFYSICIRPKFNFGLCQWFNLKQILNECLIHISRCKTSSWSEIELFTECTNFQLQFMYQTAMNLMKGNWKVKWNK